MICDWAKALSDGDAAGAAELFAVPAIVQNGTPPLRLRSRSAIVEFNRSLPCGARLRTTRREGRYTVASFRLADRPGGDCGQGAGGTASTAFLIRDGRIRQWVRVPTTTPSPSPDAEPGTQQPI